MELSGWVAILNEAETSVVDTKDLGSKPVAVKGGRVRPLIDTKPSFDPAVELLEGPVVTIGDQVTRVWTKRNKTAQELAADDDVRKESVLTGANELAYKVLFNHENRIRVLEGKQPVNMNQFRAAVRALL